MNQQRLNKIQKQAALVAIVGGSLLISLPAMAMPRMMQNQKLAQNSSSSPLNPRPSIFNEPPYNRNSGSGSDSTSGGMMQMPGMDKTSPSSSSSPSGPSSTSPQNPNLPAEAPSPYLQQQGNGDATQPTKPTGVKKKGHRVRRTSPTSTSPQNPNLPAEAPSPYLQQQGNGDATQPTKPTGVNNQSGSDNQLQNPNQPASVPSPSSNQNGANPK